MGALYLTSIGKYAYALDETKQRLYVNLYMDGQIKFNVAGQEIALQEDTIYPWDGNVSLTLNSSKPVEFGLALRIPDWCKDWSIKVNGEDVKIAPEKGYAVIDRIWSAGDKAELILDMPVMMLSANPEVRTDMGKVAIQRGPIVYCAEEVDNGPNLAGIELLNEPNFAVTHDNDLLGGVCYITAKAKRAKAFDALYKEGGVDYEETVIKLIPYYAWNNRGEGEMAVWLRREA